MSSQPSVASTAKPRLTEMAHGGGCGCKLSPAVLRELLEGQLAGQFGVGGFANLLVGNGQSDDAAVWALDEERCLVATTDFFMPVVDDPHDFGRIAATNALSDIYAMGARPLFALAILGMPLGRIDTATVRAILAGGAEAARQAGIPVAGGHSIDSAEPIYGLAVIGEVDRKNLKTNAGAKVGDALILTKPLGVGIYSAAFKRGELTAKDYEHLIATTTKLNSVGQSLGERADVHAITDVTGFGLLGHALEMARGSSVSLAIDSSSVPLLPRAREWAEAGRVTGASARNWASVVDGVEAPAAFVGWPRDILTDPQTSGGLLVAVGEQGARDCLESIRAAGFSEARIIGRASEGSGKVILSDLQ